MLSTGATRLPTQSPDQPTYTVSTSTEHPANTHVNSGERIIPIETTTSQNRV